MDKLNAAVKAAGFDPDALDLPLLAGALLQIKQWADNEAHLSGLKRQSICPGLRETGNRLFASKQSGS